MRFNRLMDGVKGDMQAEGHPILNGAYTAICKEILNIQKQKRLWRLDSMQVILVLHSLTVTKTL